MKQYSEKRSKVFSKNYSLEKLLCELSSLLAPGNTQLLSESNSEKYTKIFVVGALRSGTTLLTQWLASSGLVAYPTNLLSRFYGAPLVGAKIQQLLTDPRFNFRNEILDFTSDIAFHSENGKTKGALAPNEFWYFWRRFLPFDELDYMPPSELRKKADLAGFRSELNALANILEKPFAMKGMIMNQNIPELAEQFEKALFIWIKRDPIFNIQSALEARKRQYGDINTWYSFKIKEYPELQELSPLESVAGQIAAINHSLVSGYSCLAEQSKLVIEYEDFCSQPQYYYQEIVKRLKTVEGVDISSVPEYLGPEKFNNTNTWRLKEYSRSEVAGVYAKWLERLDQH